MQEWKSTLLGVILGITSFWSGNPHSNYWNPLSKEWFKSLLWSGFHYNLGVDSTPNEVIPNMMPKRVDFHSTALRESIPWHPYAGLPTVRGHLVNRLPIPVGHVTQHGEDHKPSQEARPTVDATRQHRIPTSQVNRTKEEKKQLKKSFLKAVWHICECSRPREGGGGGTSIMYAYWVCAARETPIFSPKFPFWSISFSQMTQYSALEHYHFTFFAVPETIISQFIRSSMHSSPPAVGLLQPARTQSVPRNFFCRWLLTN